MRNRMELIALLQDAIGGFTVEEVCRRLDAADVTYGKATPMGQVIHDPQVVANDYVIPTGDPGEDYRYTINSPIFVGDEAKKPPKRASDIGADTGDVLREFGWRDDEISVLVANGAVAGKV